MPFNIDDQLWQVFFIGGERGVFKITSSSSGIDKNKLNLDADPEKNKIPYISRSNTNNGINLFIIESQNEKYTLDEGGVITIGLDTQTIFFQPHKFFTGQNIQILRHPKINQHTVNFIIPLLKIQMDKFNWGGNGATLGRLNQTKLMLPVNKEGRIDWGFMEQFSKTLLKRKKTDYIEYSLKALNKLEYKKIEAHKSKSWHEFFIEDIAEITSGRDIYEAERINGNTPYISSTAQDNGIGHFVGNVNSTLEKNCISVNRNGSVGYSFYHPYIALFSNDCRKLRPKHQSKYVGYFLSNQISRQRKKYNYGYKMGTARLKRQKIMLPVNDHGEPDYKYMEQYMINIEYKKRMQYLDYLKSGTNGEI